MNSLAALADLCIQPFLISAFTGELYSSVKEPIRIKANTSNAQVSYASNAAVSEVLVPSRSNPA